jgi:hypothetical protein
VLTTICAFLIFRDDNCESLCRASALLSLLSEASHCSQRSIATSSQLNPQTRRAVQRLTASSFQFRASQQISRDTTMSPSVDGGKAAAAYLRPNLHVHGVGVEYPPYEIKAEDLATLARRHYPSSPAYVLDHWKAFLPLTNESQAWKRSCT